MVNKDEVLRIAINLEGENKTQFLEVQKKLAIRNRTDVLRYLIKWFFDTQLDQVEK